MKSHLITMGIAVVILFAACGESNNSITKSDEQAGEGGVAFTFKSAQFKAAEDYPAPTNVRVIVRRFEGSNLAFNALVDVEVPTDTTIIVNVPVSTNYQIDAISYLGSSSNIKPILKYDQVSGISVKSDSITNVALMLKPIELLSSSAPDSVDKGDNFTVTMDFDRFLYIPMSRCCGLELIPYASYLKVDSLYSNTTISGNTNYFDSYSGGSATTLSWDDLSVTEFEGRYAYFQAKILVSAEEFYKSNESYLSFIYNYPNPYIDDTLKTFIKTPEGGIGVTVTY